MTDGYQTIMQSPRQLEPIDYLVIGHVTQDVVKGGFTLGGTVSYASLTAHALGKRVGIVTSSRLDVPLDDLKDIQVVINESAQTSTFENIPRPGGRIQIIHHQANRIDRKHIPEAWQNTPIVHLGPVANELDPSLAELFTSSFIGVTPQGFMRKWDDTGLISQCDWLEAGMILPRTSAAVLSIEDVRFNEKRIEDYVSLAHVLVVTEGAAGSRLYWNGDMRCFKPPKETEVDATGAGDIFATAFFIRYHQTRDAWEAARFATLLAANSVTRRGLKGIPTHSEVQQASLEVLPG